MTRSKFIEAGPFQAIPLLINIMPKVDPSGPVILKMWSEFWISSCQVTFFGTVTPGHGAKSHNAHAGVRVTYSDPIYVYSS